MKKVLSIDGGGIRGLIPALVLEYIENKTQKSISESFDMIAGTSTGGILALGLSRNDGKGKAKYSATDLVEIYEKKGNDIFSRSLWKGVVSVGGLNDEKYSHDGLENILDDYFDNEPLGSSLCDVLISSYDIHNRTPLFFKSWKKEFKSVVMKEVARATSAAPTYFEPALVTVGGSMKALIDGGVFVNNPAMSAYAECKKIFPEDEISLLSLGTGELVRPIPYDEAKDWGTPSWALPLLSCIFDGVSDAVDYQLTQILDSSFVRLQTSLSIASDDMDNATRGNIENLKAEATKLLSVHKNEIDTFCDKL